jgi:hypothetical protein
MSDRRVTFDLHALCALPLVRRAYCGLVAALAAFLATLVLLREPFRGYLAEVRLAGPHTAGLDLNEATNWLKQADRNVAVIADARGGAGRAELRMTFVSLQPSQATARLDELAARWLYQYLPDRLLLYRRAALADLRASAAAAHRHEDAAHERLERLRQQQISLMLASADRRGKDTALDPFEPPAPLPAAAAPPSSTEAPGSVDRSQAVEQLQQLRAELARLAGSFTDQHPQVVALRLQIAALERQVGDMAPAHNRALGEPADGQRSPELIAPPAIRHETHLLPNRRAARLVSTAAAQAAEEAPAADQAIDQALQAALAELAEASRRRHEVEQQLSDRMQEFSNQPLAADWSARPAMVVTRLGGTPRTATLLFGGLLAGALGIVVFRAAKAAVEPPTINSTGELASVLELPVLADTLALRGTAVRTTFRLLTPKRVRAIVRLSELVVAAAVAACLVSVAVEPALSRQVAADPFGTLSEVIGRYRGENG